MGDVLPLYGGGSTPRGARRMFDEVVWAPERLGPAPDAPWAATTVSKSNSAYDPLSYWRGPVWVNTTGSSSWAASSGRVSCRGGGELRELTLRLVGAAGFSEYYHPSTGSPARKPTNSRGAQRSRSTSSRPLRAAWATTPSPDLPVVGGDVRVGYGAAGRASSPARLRRVVAVDGPAALAWEPFRSVQARRRPPSDRRGEPPRRSRDASWRRGRGRAAHGSARTCLATPSSRASARGRSTTSATDCRAPTARSARSCSGRGAHS